jgi:transcriptional regulator with XRE-family HTH domain
VTRSVTRPAVIAVASGLRAARNKRGLSLRKLADMTKTPPAVLSALETGKRPPNAARVAYLLGVLRVPAAACEQLTDLADHAGDIDYLDPTGRDETLLRTAFEQRSTQVCEWSPTLFPKALRSDGYTRALQKSGLLSSGTTIDDLVPAADRAYLAAESLHTFLIGEATTRPHACSPDVLRDQIEEATLVAALLHVSVRLVPESVCPPGLVESFTLYEDRAGAFAVAVQHHRGAVYFTSHATVAAYAKAAAKLRRVATESLRP